MCKPPLSGKIDLDNVGLHIMAKKEKSKLRELIDEYGIKVIYFF